MENSPWKTRRQSFPHSLRPRILDSLKSRHVTPRACRKSRVHKLSEISVKAILIPYHLESLSSKGQSLYDACAQRKNNDDSYSPGWRRRSFAAVKRKAEGNILLHWERLQAAIAMAWGRREQATWGCHSGRLCIEQYQIIVSQAQKYRHTDPDRHSIPRRMFFE